MKQLRKVSQTEKIIFPIAVTTLVGLVVPSTVPLLGMLMLGNLMKECGVVDRISKTAQNELMNIVTIFLGVSVGSTATAEAFLNIKTIGILDYSRESVGGAAAKDSSYLYSFLEAQGTCDVHTTAPQPQEPEEYDPNSFVISDPSTWPPVNDPRYENFDPENPATWPNAGQPSETPSPGESGQPNPPETSTSPTPSPVPTPVETPPDEPYIPADGTK